MDKEPLFTVVMATYNRAHLLPRAVNSVLNQSYHNFELIIVDDASTDNTETVCRSFKDNRICYYRHEQNKGTLATKNKGIDLATGDYIAFLDDDDELVKEALEIAVNKFIELSSKGIQIIWFDDIDYEKGRRSGFGITKEGYIRYDDLLCGRIYGDFWLVIKRDALQDDDRFDERLWGDEGILWLKLHRRCKSFYVPMVLYRAYREHGERVSVSPKPLKNIERSALTHRVFLEKYGEELKELCPKVYGRRLAILGASQILIGEKSEGRKAFRESLKYCISSYCLLIFLLSFILNSRQIKSLASNYIRIKNM